MKSQVNVINTKIPYKVLLVMPRTSKVVKKLMSIDFFSLSRNQTSNGWIPFELDSS